MRSVFLAAALVLTLACDARAEASAAEIAAFNAALNSIQAEDLLRHATRLADDTFEGREAGSRGGRAAARYIGREFKRCGLAGCVGEKASYYQPFDAGYHNILGKIEGADPDLKDEVILIGAHYDHVGYGNPTNSYGPTGFIHNGADDNASGIAGVIELAEAFATSNLQPRRSIIFALWDGEEKGLLGSKHWTANPTCPIKNVKLAINCDMLGRLGPRHLEIYGTRTGFGMRELVARANRDVNLPLRFTWEIKENSDHYSFMRMSVPTLMFHSGLHDDYHRPSDDAEKLDGQGMQQAVRLLLGVTLAAANAPSLSGFRSIGMQESPTYQRALETPMAPPPSRLGVSWDPNFEGEGLRLTGVRSNSPARRAGLQIGDRLLTFDGVALSSKTDFASLVFAAEDNVEATYVRGETGEPQTVTIALRPSLGRLGISWRGDSAEPGSVLIVRCIAGSPAVAAGLQVGDRVYAVDGQTFASSEEFQNLVIAAEAPVLDIERDGQWRQIQLTPAARAN